MKTTMNKKYIGGGSVIVLVVLIAAGVFFKTSRHESTSTAGYAPKMMGAEYYADEEAHMNTFGISQTGVSSRNSNIAPSPGYGESASDDTTVGQERMIIKTGNMGIVVEDVSLAVEQVEQFAIAKGGFVVQSNMYTSALSPVADVTIRIPVEVFDSGVDELQSLGKVESKSMNGQDVTEEFVDLDAQVRNLERTEAQFLEIMGRATKIEDVLAVQREVSQVRSQIERIEGRMNYLSKSAKLSTLTVHLATNPDTLPVIDEDTWKPLADAKDAFRSLIALGQGIVTFLIWVAMYIPVWAVFFFLGRFIYNKVRS